MNRRTEFVELPLPSERHQQRMHDAATQLVWLVISSGALALLLWAMH